MEKIDKICIMMIVEKSLAKENGFPLQNAPFRYIIIFVRNKFYFENGALAQLGECLHGMQEVTGSSPVCSITHEAH